jgi:hypothetical protein
MTDEELVCAAGGFAVVCALVRVLHEVTKRRHNKRRVTIFIMADVNCFSIESEIIGGLIQIETRLKLCVI